MLVIICLAWSFTRLKRTCEQSYFKILKKCEWRHISCRPEIQTDVLKTLANSQQEKHTGVFCQVTHKLHRWCILDSSLVPGTASSCDLTLPRMLKNLLKVASYESAGCTTSPTLTLNAISSAFPSLLHEGARDGDNAHKQLASLWSPWTSSLNYINAYLPTHPSHDHSRSI